MGTSNGGIQPDDGTAYVKEEFIALRLNVSERNRCCFKLIDESCYRLTFFL
jgi:hypothetical protein